MSRGCLKNHTIMIVITDHLSVLAGFRIAHATCAHVPMGLILKSQQNHSRFSCIVLDYI